ncbi:unnamed protein product [Closterium sp. NIES-54]
MVPNRSGRSSLPLPPLLLLLLASSPPHSTFSPARAAPIGAQLPPASVPPVTRNRGSNSTSVDTPPPCAWHPPLILPVGSPHYAAHERLRWSPRQRHVFGRHSARLVEGNAAFQHDADGEEPAVRGRSLAATAAAGAGAGECDAEWMLLWPTQGCWRPRMTTAKGGTSAPSSSHRLATAQSVTSAGAEIAQASAPAPTSSDGGGGDGGSAPPAGSEARLTPENEIIGVCRSGGEKCPRYGVALTCFKNRGTLGKGGGGTPIGFWLGKIGETGRLWGQKGGQWGHFRVLMSGRGI